MVKVQVVDGLPKPTDVHDFVEPTDQVDHGFEVAISRYQDEFVDLLKVILGVIAHKGNLRHFGRYPAVDPSLHFAHYWILFVWACLAPFVLAQAALRLERSQNLFETRISQLLFDPLMIVVIFENVLDECFHRQTLDQSCIPLRCQIRYSWVGTQF